MTTGQQPSTGRHPAASQPMPPRINEATGLARAIGVLLNTARTYETSHAVFQRALEERMPLFEVALKGIHDITLYFTGGQIRYGTLPLEPGLNMFQDLALKFEKLGIHGLIFLPGITASELKSLLELIIHHSEDIPHRGLQPLLDREGVKNIQDCKSRMGILKEKEAAPKETPPPTVIMDRSDRSKPAASGGGGARPMTFDIEEDAGAPDDEPVAEKYHPGELAFHGYVRDTLESVARDRAAALHAAESINAKFQEVLEEQIEGVRRESEQKVRRLDIIKDMVLKELEAHQLAAIVCDSRLNILAANNLGRELMGNANALTKGGPLERFIASGLERQVIEINGAPRVAHAILSVEPISREGALLISIE